MAPARVYLAGPDVFLPDPVAAAERKKALCVRYGFTGVFPLDAEIELGGLAPRAAALAISRANEALIHSCQLVVANVTPFRGPSADVGTAYEMGFARALSLPVFAYSNVAEDFSARTKRYVGGGQRRADGTWEDEDALQIEPFATFDNLMLEGAVEDSGGSFVCEPVRQSARYLDLSAFERCLERARGLFQAASRSSGPSLL